MQKACESVFAAPENTADLPLLTELVKETGHLSRQEDDAIIVTAPRDWSSELSRLAISKGIYLRELRPQCESLEDIFLSMTSGEAAK